MNACNNCGLLARRYVIGEIVEADDMFRETGKSTGIAPFPTCTAMAADLEQEYTALESVHAGDPVLKVIQKDRSDCPEWTPWMRGFSPKEHREMLIRKEEQDRNESLVKSLEDMRAQREEGNWWLGVIGIGIVLILATLAAPIMSALIVPFVEGPLVEALISPIVEGLFD